MFYKIFSKFIKTFNRIFYLKIKYNYFLSYKISPK